MTEGRTRTILVTGASYGLGAAIAMRSRRAVTALSV
ncbi:hypothetical protein SAMN05421678_103334 [Actinopolymorpha cephalotaxi]|uniref:Short-subunit dehydrogenase n=1 Tax=Actinopolymorpha cephalotaxi TaxID=504797 RepID=A0A1I2NLS1_9ACTN|nr:short-subunit dehydrogenase [Actinopolymorpha cephalotaxi]SFG02221.1 hypothetical protein SAMN05421678_103334 [Actinopolymorpha cephalotaxi]